MTSWCSSASCKNTRTAPSFSCTVLCRAFSCPRSARANTNETSAAAAKSATMGGLMSASTAMANTSCVDMDTKLGMMVATPLDTTCTSENMRLESSPEWKRTTLL